MSAPQRIIDGKQAALRLREGIAREVAALRAEHGAVPGLAVVLLGDDPASDVYVRSKARATAEAGMESFEFRLKAATPTEDLLTLIQRLNADARVHGVLVQLPLPAHIDPAEVLEAIDPMKDVDGFHPVNVGRLALGRPALAPCTPVGCMKLLKEELGDLAGKNAVVVGRSDIVGKPMAQLLLAANCTVTIAHSKSENLPEICRAADILVAAVGRPEMIKGSWIKPGAVVIDVGINRIEREEKRRLVGDVDFTAASQVAGAITPVPGGVGPMTIACLLDNTLEAFRRSRARL